MDPRHQGKVWSDIEENNTEMLKSSLFYQFIRLVPR